MNEKLLTKNSPSQHVECPSIESMNELVSQIIRDREAQSECVNGSPGKLESLFAVAPIDLNGDGKREL